MSADEADTEAPDAVDPVPDRPLRLAAPQPPATTRLLQSGPSQPVTTTTAVSLQSAATAVDPGTASEILIDGTPTNGSNPWIDSLVWGSAWADTAGLPSTGGDVTITYCFVQGTDPYGVLSGASLNWTSAGLTAVDSALASWENVAKIDFVNTTDIYAADVWIWQGTASQAYGALGWSEVPAFSSGQPLFTVFNGEDPSWSSSGLAKGGYGYVTAVHELGHLLGLAHPHDGGEASDGNVFPGVDRPFGNYGDYSLNQGIYTAMSYNDGWKEVYPTHSDNAYGWEATPMALDIAAIQTIYGARTTVATGNDTYVLPTLNAAGTYWSCIWDTGGLDTISNAGSTVASIINLNAATLAGAGGGGFVSYASGIVGGYTIANGVIIENAIGGTAADAITGNSSANSLVGADGNDTLVGGNGNDTLDGGSGSDSLNGGDNDDLYIVDSATDLVSEDFDDALGGLADTIQTAITYVLGSGTSAGQNGFGIENLTLTGTTAINGTGNAKDNLITGNSAANSLAGGAGNDTLDGGAGNDTLNGGAGNDVFVVDSSSDVVTEATNDATGGLNDTVRASVTYTLGSGTAAGQNGFGIENLELTGVAAISGSGNANANKITGNASANTLNGGLGADTMNGGDGNDLYIVDNAADFVTEFYDDFLGGNADTVQASVTYILASGNASGRNGFGIENLTLTGTTAINGTGNAKDNLITGNSAANSLAGGAGNDTLDGGAGNDTLNGGAGNDVFVVDSSSDVVTEATNDATGGLNDTVRASISYTLAAGTAAGQNGFGIENLTLTGTAAINGTGNAKNNLLIGNGGNNVLQGNAGADQYITGGGLDTINLSFGSGSTSASSTASTTDWITDLTYLSDKIDLLTSTGGALAAPVSLARLADNSSATTKASLAATMFNGLAANAARICVATNAAFGSKTFLAINDGTATYSSTTDLFLEISGISSLPAVGTISVSNLFI